MIQGFMETSFVDYPDNICAVMFLSGCNMRCPYCHNADLVKGNLPTISFDFILEQIQNKKHLIDGVCITGGEPTLCEKLPFFIQEIKKLGLKVKLDSNGSNPDVLKALLEQNLVDFIAMDIKQVPEKYDLVRYKNAARLHESIKLIMNSEIDYEFRTTVVPGFTNKNDIKAIAKLITGAKRYSLQQFNPSNKQFDISITKQYPHSFFKEIGEEIKDNFEKFHLKI